jgi:HSP20 family molecular chaperone IbpA
MNIQSTNFAQRSCTTGTFSQRAKEQQQRQQQQLGVRGREKAPSSAAELSENHEWMRLTLDLPGVQLKDLDVNINHGVLTIEGSRRTMSVDGSVCVKKQKISRHYAIDTDVVDVHSATANLKLGVLTIKAPIKSKPNRRLLDVTENDGRLTATPNAAVKLQPNVSLVPIATVPHIAAPTMQTSPAILTSDEEAQAMSPPLFTSTSLLGASVKEEPNMGVQPGPVISDPPARRQ